MERAKNTDKNKDLLKGFGQSIVLQGAFLLLFDIGATIAQNTHSGALKSIIQGLSFSGETIGFQLVF